VTTHRFCKLAKALHVVSSMESKTFRYISILEFFRLG
jgi:hypothetical protein